MIDQADFAGIDAYVKKHELQDASMAETRKAKKLNINKKRGEETNGEQLDEGPGELEKAQQEIEDEEDEEEEDYDPGSEGESEGSGDSGEEVDYHNEAEEENGDLVADELGSEAEDVEDESDPEDGDQL